LGESDPKKWVHSGNFIGPNSITLQLINVSPIDENSTEPNIRENFKSQLLFCTGETYLKNKQILEQMNEGDRERENKIGIYNALQYYKILSYKTFYKRVLGEKIAEKKIVGDNNITEIPDEIGRLTNLIELIVSYNLITNINTNIINCRSLQLFRYNGNPVENISPSVTRFLRNTIGYSKDDRQLEVYDDNQNIHNHIIQESIRKSIMNIINQNLKIDEDKIMSEIYDDSILSLKTKKLIEEYSKDTYYHSVLLITFKELLLHVWEIIEANDHKDEIKSILNNEILDSECKCFTGRLSRLVNCLNGFSNLIEIKISDNQQIGNIIIIIRNELISQNSYSIEEHKKKVIEELKTRGYDDVVINEWIEEIE
jgi:hypothetical protein